VGVSVGYPSEQITPQAQAGHEGGQDGGDGEDGMTEDQAENPGPEDLIDQAGRPREEETKGDGGKDLFRLLLDSEDRIDLSLHRASLPNSSVKCHSRLK
jgi:hypothetical protein